MIPDSQREKVYRAEGLWRSTKYRKPLIDRSKNHTDAYLLRTCQTYANRVFEALVKAGWSLPPPRIYIRSSRATISHAFSDGRIELSPRHGLTQATIIHEVSHLAVSSRLPGHGILFARAELDAVEAMFGTKARDDLARHFTARGVQYSWEKRNRRNLAALRHTQKHGKGNFPVRVTLRDGKIVTFKSQGFSVEGTTIVGTARRGRGDDGPVTMSIDEIAWTEWQHDYCDPETCRESHQQRENWY